VLFYVVLVCKCVLPPGDNPIAVNKYYYYYFTKGLQTGNPVISMGSVLYKLKHFSMQIHAFVIGGCKHKTLQQNETAVEATDCTTPLSRMQCSPTT
jgi:hypothetical protein